MALLKSTLEAEMSKFWDRTSPNFEGHPNDFGQAAYLWSEAISKYMLALTPPSKTQVAAKQALKLDLNLVFASQTNSVNIFGVAFDKYADAIGVGMAPEFTFTPPVSFPINTIVTVGKSTTTMKEGLGVWVDAIDSWIRTATATPNSGGSPILWS